MITWWNTFAPEDIYFKSLVNSGNLVLIDDYEVSREIEAVYTTRKERVIVNLTLLKENSDKIRSWAEEKRNKSKEMVSREFVFNEIFNYFFQGENNFKNWIVNQNLFDNLNLYALPDFLNF